MDATHSFKAQAPSSLSSLVSGHLNLGTGFSSALGPQPSALLFLASGHLNLGTKKLPSPYIPNFQFVLYDLPKFSDEDIKGEILCRTGLLLLKHVFTPGYEQKIPDILSLLKTLLEKQTGLQYIETVIRYILTTAENMTAEDLKQVVEEKLSADRGAMIMTAYQALSAMFQERKQYESSNSYYPRSWS